MNTVLPNAIRWLPDAATLLVRFVDGKLGRPPAAPSAPIGPVVQVANGKAAPAVTFQDLLKDPHDEDLFDYYAGGQFRLIDTRTGQQRMLGTAGRYERVEPSPDGRFFLALRMERPYSYAVPFVRFGSSVEIWNRAGRVVRTLARIPLHETATADIVPTGPRDISWRPNAPATLVWAEAQDGGDPKTAAAIRDHVMLLADPNASPRKIAETKGRFEGIDFLDESDLALVRQYDRDARITTVSRLDVRCPVGLDDLFTALDRDSYRDPGQPIYRRTRSGGAIVVRDGDAIFLRGSGFGPDGQRPFLDRFDLRAKTKTRSFQSELEPLESVTTILDAKGTVLLTQQQSPSTPPNLFVRTLHGGPLRALTHIADPAPQLHAIGRRVVRYRRADGIDLSFTLYLPPGYKEGTRLPTFLWAYPLEFNDRGAAAQITNTAQTFAAIGGASPIFSALAGYAVLDNAAIPIVGDPQTVNDTYVEQLTTSAKAAIDKAVELGVTDPDRVAVGGHSYGAFMTANLLVHSDLFRAGVARSGAYNRTLTPFGFQSERRTYWEAPELYNKLSPFAHVDRIHAPLLLIHGMIDDNTGTYPLQSERMFAALRGNGATARLVMLPFEAHGYLARQSIETTLAETIEWLDQYVKNAPPRPKKSGV